MEAPASDSRLQANADANTQPDSHRLEVKRHVKGLTVNILINTPIHRLQKQPRVHT